MGNRQRKLRGTSSFLRCKAVRNALIGGTEPPNGDIKLPALKEAIAKLKIEFAAFRADREKRGFGGVALVVPDRQPTHVDHSASTTTSATISPTSSAAPRSSARISARFGFSLQRASSLRSTVSRRSRSSRV